MKYAYSLGHRIIAHVLLGGFLLQSCFNPHVPLPIIPHTDKQEIPEELRTRTKVSHQQEETLLSGQSIDILSTPNTDTGKRQTSDHQLAADTLDEPEHQPSIQPIHKKQLSQRGQVNQKTLEGKRPNLLLSHQKATTTAISAKPPRFESQLHFPPTPTKKHLQPTVEIPEIRGISTQPSSPATVYYEAKGGYQVKFIQKGQVWTAHVQDSFIGFHGSFEVPVYIEMGTSIQDLAKHTPEWVKSRIQVCPPATDKKGYVWVGRAGLQGGGAGIFNFKINMGEHVPKEPIHVAAQEGNLPQIVRLSGISWLSLKIDEDVINMPDANLNTPLHYAAFNGQEAAIDLLLLRGAKRDLQDNLGKAALHYAKTERVATALIQKGANINIQDNQGSTPLHQAATYDNLDLVRLFLQKGANKEATDHDGNRPLHLASNKDIVQLLLNYGAGKEAKNAAGKTPLLDAVENNNLAKIRLLIEKGANKEARNNAGDTVLHQAIVYFLEQLEKIDLLRNGGNGYKK